MRDDRNVLCLLSYPVDYRHRGHLYYVLPVQGPTRGGIQRTLDRYLCSLAGRMAGLPGLRSLVASLRDSLLCAGNSGSLCPLSLLGVL